MKEPQSDAEFEEAIKQAGYTFHDHDGRYTIKCIKGGAVTGLENTNLSDALFEAWNLVCDPYGEEMAVAGD